MTSPKIPLFGGMIQPLHEGVGGTAEINPIFTPPDADSDNPVTYEVHLWALPAGIPEISSVGEVWSVVATENPTGKAAFAWSTAVPTYTANKPIKVLDGYPVRGNVSLSFLVAGAGADHYPVGPQMWGYYYIVGQGKIKEDERRFIGRQDLKDFNAGVGFMVKDPVSAVPVGAPTIVRMHTFEPNRIDEMSIQFSPALPHDVIVALVFMKKDDTPVIPGHGVLFYLDYSDFPPGAGQYPPSPYMIYQAAFGGGGEPLLDHLRLDWYSNGGIGGDSAAAGNGYFMRR